MAVSVRMEPLLEMQLELAAKRQGVTKSQFIVSAVRLALGEQTPYSLLLKLEAEAQASPEYQGLSKAFEGTGYQGDLSDPDAMREFIKNKLRRKHGFGAG